MATAVEFHPAAAAETETTYRWYRERSPTTAAAFRDELEGVIALIADAPERPAALSSRYGSRTSPVGSVCRGLPTHG